MTDKLFSEAKIIQGVRFNLTFLSKSLKSTFFGPKFLKYGSFERQDLGICKFEKKMHKNLQSTHSNKDAYWTNAQYKTTDID